MSGTRKSVRVIRRHGLRAAVGEMDRVALLVEHEVEHVLQVAHPLLAMGSFRSADASSSMRWTICFTPVLVQHLSSRVFLACRAAPGRS
jgi:hypothetical protein